MFKVLMGQSDTVEIHIDDTDPETVKLFNEMWKKQNNNNNNVKEEKEEKSEEKKGTNLGPFPKDKKTKMGKTY
jgi:hypothetical protein